MITAASIGWATTASPLFRVRSIRVEGNERVSDGEVISLAGAVIGKHIATLDLEAIADRLDAHPWVLRSTADRSLPGTLVLSVRERSPVAWAQDPKGYVLLAPDGVVLERRDRAPRGIEIPSISTALRPGDRLPSIDLLVIAGSLPPEVAVRVLAVHPGTHGTILDLVGGGRVLYGDPSDRAEKAAAIASLLRWSREQGIEVGYIDVRAPRSPSIRPAS